MQIIDKIGDMFKKTDKINDAKANYDATEILTQYESCLYNMSLYNPYNPDPLVIKKSLNIFDEMYMGEEQIQTLLKLKKSFIIGQGFTIKSYDLEDEKQKEFIDFLYFCLESNYKGIFENALSEILSSFQFGFSVSEIVLNQITRGKYKGKIGLERIITRPPHSFEFHLNPQGDLVKLKQNGMYNIVDDLPVDKFLIYTNESQFGNPYGVSDLRVIYRWYLLKDMLIKFAAIAGERNSMPYAIAKVPKNTSTDARAVFLNILSKMQAKGCAVLDDDAKIELLESAKAGNQEYFKLMIELCNNHMALAFVFPELLGFSSHNTGSQALGREQKDIYYYAVPIPQQKMLANMIGERVFKKLIDINFGEQDNYPYMEFILADDTKIKELIATYILAVDKGVIKNTIEDENLIREKLGHSEREEDERDLPVVPPNKPAVKEPNIKEPIIEEPKKEPINIKEEKKEPKKEFAEVKFKRELTEFEENVSFNELVSNINDDESELALGLSNIANDIKDYVEKKIIDEKIVEKKKFNVVADLTMPNKFYNQLLKTFSTSLDNSYKKSYKIAKKDTKNALNKRTEFLEKQYTIGAIDPKQSISYITSKGVNLTGTEEKFILKNVENILNDGLKTGKTQSQIISNLEVFFDQYSVDQLTAAGKSVGIQNIGGRLATVVRTNLNDAYNQGRMALYNQPDVKEFVEALQYSAIIDDDTTDFCSSMDGKIYPASDAIWDTITPPNHFNCRSILIPVLMGEKYDVSKKLKIEPAKGFGGNA